MGEQRTYEFHCERWLSSSREDRKMEREVYERNYKGDRGAGSTTSVGSTRPDEPFGAQSKLREEQRPTGPSMTHTMNSALSYPYI